jgi:hypothetical protein
VFGFALRFWVGGLFFGVGDVTAGTYVVSEDSSGFLRTDGFAVLTMFTALFGAGVLYCLVGSAEYKLFWFASNWALTCAFALHYGLFC